MLPWCDYVLLDCMLGPAASKLKVTVHTEIRDNIANSASFKLMPVYTFILIMSIVESSGTLDTLLKVGP